MGMMDRPPDLIVVLPLPHADLSPNASVPTTLKGRIIRQKRKAKARLDGGMAAIIAMNAIDLGRPQWSAATAQCRFYFRDRRARDKDNAAASMKAAMDGLTDAGVWIDDSVVTPLAPIFDIDRDQPRVEIDIWGGV